MRKLRREMDFWRTKRHKRRARIKTELKRFVLSSLLAVAVMGTCIARREMCGPLLPENKRTMEIKRNLYPPTRPLEVLTESKMSDAGIKQEQRDASPE